MNNFIDRFKYAYKRKAFTLIELIIVIAVIAILAGLALPKFLGVRRDANVSALKNDLDTLETVFSMYNVNSDDDTLPIGDKVSIDDIEKSDNFTKYMLDNYEDDLTNLYKIDWTKANQYLQRLKNDKDNYYYSANSGKIVYPLGKVDADGNEHFVLDGNGISGNGDTNSPTEEVPEGAIDAGDYWYYSELADKWTEGITSIPTYRMGLTSQVVDGKVYCIGGHNRSSYDLNTVEIYDIESDSWTAGTPMPTPRKYLTSQAVDGKIYCIGGSYSNTVEIYDIETDTWTIGASMPTYRCYLTSVLIDNKIYCIGGYFDTATYLNTIEVYDIATDTWTSTLYMPNTRGSITSQVIDGKIYCIGGNNDKVDIYDTKTKTWSTGTPISSARSDIKSVAINSKIYCFGGFNSAGHSNAVEIYDTETDTWTTGTPMSFSRCYFSPEVIDGKIYCFGGNSSRVDIYDTGYRPKN